MTLAELQAQRERILAEMGAPDLQFAERGVKRRPQPELDAALARLDLEIATAQSPQSRQFVIQTSRGI
jgi:hypothetical protein